MKLNLIDNLKREKEDLFSFYLISGNREENKKELFDFLENELGFITRGNPDFFLFEGEKFLIEKAREVKEINSKTIVSNDIRVFIFSFDSVAEDTQNALLKVLEEPIDNTIFFFLVSDLNNILATIKSRSRIIEIISKNISKEVEEYLSSDFLEREKITADLDKSEISSFFNSLELILLERKKHEDGFSDFYKRFLSLKKYVGQKGVSYKNIFTYLNIYLPKIK